MLNDRDTEILQLIVDLYTREGGAVSSRRVKESTGIGVSTATIRSAMARLEQTGYIRKRHTSSGRIPTDEGYRFFVDTLERRNTYCADFSDRFQTEIREQDLEVNAVMASASRVLGMLSKNFAVVYGSIVQECRVRRIRLVTLDSGRLLTVVHMSPEYERTAVLRMEKQFAPDVVQRAEDWINATVENKTLTDAKQSLDAAVRDNVTDEGILVREISIHREEIFSEPPAVEFYYEESDYLVDHSELNNPSLMRLLLKLVHNKEYLTTILSDRSNDGTQITIGREHSDSDLRAFSLVTAGYQIGAARGILGVIGPTRMRYDVNRDLVGAAARELTALGERYF